MRSDAIARVLLVAVALSVGVGVAVWVGRQERVARPPAVSHPTQTGLPMSLDDKDLCAQRLAKLGRALRLYAADHDGAYPVTPTPAKADVRLGPDLERYRIAPEHFFCPVAQRNTGLPFVYHSYRALEPGQWPNWMLSKHVVTPKSPGGTWLMADVIDRDAPGPHSRTEKAFNYLRADGSVAFHAGRPRDVYR